MNPDPSNPFSTEVSSTRTAQENNGRTNKRTVGLGLIGVAIAVIVSSDIETDALLCSPLIPYVWFACSAGLVLIADSISVALRYFVACFAGFSGIMIIATVYSPTPWILAEKNSPTNKTIALTEKVETHTSQDTPSTSQASNSNLIEESCREILRSIGSNSKLSKLQGKKNWKHFVDRPFSWQLKVLEVRRGPIDGFIVRCSCSNTSPLPDPGTYQESGEHPMDNISDLEEEGRQVTAQLLNKHIDKFLYIEISFSNEQKDFVNSLQPGKSYEFNGTLVSHFSIFGLEATANN